MLRLAPRAPQLYPFARSRANPVRRTAHPFSKLRLKLDELLLWRLAAGASPAGRLLPRLPPLLAERAALSETGFDAHLARAPRAAATLLAAEGAAVFADALEVIRREMGFVLRENQIACACALLNGDCAELRTGEGKTLSAALAALVAARVGVSSHVITVNDYLAERDFAQLAPMARRLGVSCAVVLQKMTDDEKRAAYDADIVYGTNKTFVFDHLRDRRDGRTTPGAVPRQMGQALAICDEADSVLIDDATVPMILSRMGSDLPEADLVLFRSLDAFTATLVEGRERAVDPHGAWRLTPRGIARLEAASADWSHPLARTDDILALCEKALAARFQFREGEAWVRGPEGLQMIDQSTGRLMPDRRWEYGLQQLVELAAGVEPSPDSTTLAQATQQTFFRQYRLLAGMTGTARECRPEFWAIYRLRVRHIAPHAPSRLVDHGLRVFRDAARKWQHVADRAEAMARERSVLVGLNDVTEAAALAAVFAARGREVAVLDALAEAEEAALVAQAGQRGRITVATHLAGRGTDIKLAPEVRASGGLHVIIASTMASARLERQLYGRAGRAGDPGSFERAVALTDRALSDGATSLLRQAMTLLLALPLPFLHPLALARVQAERDRKARGQRRKTMLREQDLVKELGYT